MPTTLPLILERGKGNIYKVNLDFTEYLDTNDTFVLSEAQQDDFYEYQSSVSHYGESGPNAHFMAYRRSAIDGKLYRYNDAMVEPLAQVNNNQGDDFNKTIVELSNPYILFYTKMSDERKLSKTLDFLSENAKKKAGTDPKAMQTYIKYSNKMRKKFEDLKKAGSGVALQKYTYLLGFCWMNRSC